MKPEHASVLSNHRARVSAPQPKNEGMPMPATESASDLDSSVALDPNGFAILDRETSLDLAARARLGRVSVTRDALPLILPVAFGLIDGAPVFRLGSAALREAAERSSVCSFETDDAADDWSWAWSVSIIGPVTLVTDADQLARAEELLLPTWSRRSPETAYARVDPAIVSGRLQD
jgi:hypothetical protein